MRNYALAYGSPQRQRTNRQETTMARHCTMRLPEMIYQRQLQISSDIFRKSQLSVVWSVYSAREWRGHWHSWQQSRECRCGGCRVWSWTDVEEEVKGGGSHIPELDRRSTFLFNLVPWERGCFPAGNYYTFWATNKNQQQISDERDILIHWSVLMISTE